MEKGADFDLKNINGKKPSELAYDSGFYDVSDILLTKENEKYKGSIIEEKNDDDDFMEDLKDKDEKEIKIKDKKDKDDKNDEFEDKKDK